MTQTLAQRAEEFAARRTESLLTLAEVITPLVADALAGPRRSFAKAILTELRPYFAEVYDDADGPSRDWAYQRWSAQLRPTLRRTQADGSAAQVERIATWLATALLNGATWWAARPTATRQKRVKQWLTMRDDAVRDTHQRLHGDTVALAGTFDVGGHRLAYPGQPIGPPEVWINCRCVLWVREEEDTVTAAVSPGRQVVIVAVPADDDPVWEASSEQVPHMTVLYLGDDVPEDALPAINAAVASVATHMPAMDLPVRGREPLGDDEADVLMLDGFAMQSAREILLADPVVREAFDAAFQYPQWTPHVTLGYPATPATGEPPTDAVRFDRLAVWTEDYAGEEFLLSATPDAETDDDDYIDMGATEPDDEDEDELDDDQLRIDTASIEMEPVPWHGVLVVEGEPTGDHREFTEGAIEWREVPLPLLWVEQSTNGHDGAIVVGHATELWRDRDNPRLIRGRGVFASTPEADKVVGLIAEKHLRGVSIDIDLAELAEDEESEMTTFTKGRISAATLVAIPAFAQAFIALGTGEGVADESLVAAIDVYVSEQPWDGSASRFTPEQWKASCILHVCDGLEKSCHKLPIREPGGALSRAGVHAAAGRIGQVDAPPAAIAAAKGRLRSAYDELGEEPPDSLAASAVPGLLEDGSPPQCHYCEERATHYVLHSEGMAFVPACDEHLDQAKTDAATSVPDGTYDRGNIDAVGQYATFAPGTRDGPGWITNPVATERIRRYWVRGKGAAKIRWGQPHDFYRCRRQLAKYVQNPEWLNGLCANMHKEALGIWPGEHDADMAITASHNDSPPVCTECLDALIADGVYPADTPAPAFTMVTAARPTLPAEWFSDPGFTERTPLTITDEGRVYGHLATWGTCHIGIPGACVTPPESRTQYAYFRTGAVMTDQGSVPVGQITMATGHAGRDDSSMAAKAHYDHTGTVVCDVAAGEDGIGIWVAGALRPGVTDDQRRALQAASLSGDWRSIGGHLELVAALAVNVPGFPIPRVALAASAEGGQLSLVAAGVVDPKVREQARTGRRMDVRRRAAMLLARDASG